MTSKQRMQQARDLIKAKQYDEARIILETIDHPTAREWIAKLDQMRAKSRATRPVETTSPPVVYPHEQQGTNKLPAGGILLMLLAAVVVGVLIGALLFMSSKLIYLICLSPIIAAGIGGWIMMQAIKLGKVRHGLVTLLFGLALGGVAYGTFRYGEYLDFRTATREAILSENVNIDSSNVDFVLDAILEEETGSPGFFGFVTLQARSGMTLTNRRAATGGDGIVVNQQLTIAYWVLEIILMLAIAGVLASSQAGEPFCEDTNQWLKMREIGQVSKEYMEEFLQLLQAEDFRSAGRLIEHGKVKSKSLLKVEAGHCHDQAPEARLRIKAYMTSGSRSREEDVFDGAIPAQAYHSLVG